MLRAAALLGPRLRVALPLTVLPVKQAYVSLVRSYATVLERPVLRIGLGSLSDNPGATRNRKRLGRGPSSGKGKTSGRGQKGQKARSGRWKPRREFEGGQVPITKLFPKRGFKNPLGNEYSVVNLDRLQHWIDRGRINPNERITVKQLTDSRCIRGVKDGVTLLANGHRHFKTLINVEVSRASKKAIRIIERLGGTIVCRYYNELSLRATLHPEKFWRMPKFADPKKKRDIAWYSDPKNRGYLADPHEIEAERTRNRGQQTSKFLIDHKQEPAQS